MNRRLLLTTSLASCLTMALAPARASTGMGRLPPPDIGGPLDLLDQRGQRFSLDRLRGRPALLFFGFTRCSSTCPVAMATARQLFAEAPPDGAPSVLFVTLDPLTDGPREVGDYVARIDPRMIGLTGTPQQVALAAEAYGVGKRVVAQGVEHSSMWYLLDAAGKVRWVYPYDAAARDLARSLAALERPSASIGATR